jgi:threonine dehydrogenase-like Zn-dependent dehydrogenase
MTELAQGVRLRFESSARNYRAMKLLGPRLPRLLRGRMPWLELASYPLPALPGPDWVRVRPTLAGICGTDMALLTGHTSAILSPFASFPAVLGHEIVGVVGEVGDGVTRVQAGQRVVVDPLISCAMRGLPACPWCADGLPGLCLNATDGALAPGPMIGFCRDLPGGWSDAVLVHDSQLHLVPDAVPDEVAVLVEPLSVAMHGVLRRPPRAGEAVLVIGGGTMGLSTIAALTMSQPGVAITAVARYDLQARQAQRLGATHVVRSRDPEGPVRAAVAEAGARAHEPLVGPTVLSGGFDLVYDCVGTRSSLDAALRAAGPRGEVVILGGPTEIGPLDWTLAWTRELRLVGTYVYGLEPSLPDGQHTFDRVLELLVAHPDLPLDELVTHRFGLRDWRRAMRTALTHGSQAGLKIAFEVPPG